MTSSLDTPAPASRGCGSGLASMQMSPRPRCLCPVCEVSAPLPASRARSTVCSWAHASCTPHPPPCSHLVLPEIPGHLSPRSCPPVEEVIRKTRLPADPRADPGEVEGLLPLPCPGNVHAVSPTPCSHRGSRLQGQVLWRPPRRRI